MVALVRGWFRSRKISILFVVVAALFVVYYILGQDTIMEQKWTRSVLHSGHETPHVAPDALKNEPDVRKNIPTKNKPNIGSLRGDIVQYVEKTIQEALKAEKGTGCDIPKLDPFAPEVTKFDKDKGPIVCKGEDWVSCQFNKCRVKESILKRIPDVECSYRNMILVSDAKQYLETEATLVRGAGVYTLVRSDHAQVACAGNSEKWAGMVIGFRDVKPPPVPLGRKGTPNILILGFDSTSKNGFIRRMPLSYKVLKNELGAVILNGYNIVGDGTPAALFPILTGSTELELPEVRKRVGSKGHLDTFPFLWYTLSKDGYRTAYFEDSPRIGTFQYRFTGFQKQPTDHYLRAFFLEYISKFASKNSAYCVGDTPSHALMMNLTRQFMHLDPTSKKFIFTFIADITHDDFNFISTADERLVQWLRGVRDDGTLENTLLVVMGDHGPRYANVRNTLQGKQEERLPLMSFVLPKSFVRRRPEALANLKANADVLTTPFDLHNTLLDLVGLTGEEVATKVEGADLPRSMSLFHKVPANRSCSEAGIEPHWCTCLKWQPVDPQHEMFARVGRAFVDFINGLTSSERSKCVERTLVSIESVSKRTANPKLLAFRKNKDVDGYLGSFDAHMTLQWDYYELKIIVGPGNGIYEASMSYNIKTNKFLVTNRDISRINAYNDEPSCISATRPDLNMYCYCKT